MFWKFYDFNETKGEGVKIVQINFIIFRRGKRRMFQWDIRPESIGIIIKYSDSWAKKKKGKYSSDEATIHS